MSPVTRHLPWCLLLAAAAATVGCSQHKSSGLDLTSLNTKINPCSDFYGYACGNYAAHNPIPADQAAWGSFYELDERNRDELHKLLDTAVAKPDANDTVQRQVGAFYSACMNTTLADQKGAAPLDPQLDQIAAITSTNGLAPVVAQMQTAGADVLFGFGSDQDFKNSNSEIAEADQGGLGLPDRDYYTKTDAASVEMRKQYQAHVAKVFGLLGDAPAKAAQEAQTVMTLETKLAQASQTNVERRDPNAVYHKMTTPQLAALTPDFDWKAFYGGLQAPTFDSVNVVAPDFYRALAGLLRTVPLDDWKTYLRWHAAHAAAPYLSQPFVDANFEFYGATLTGQKEQKARWKRCVTATDSGLGEALGKLYVEAVFGPQAKRDMLQMVHNLETALGNDIRTVPWMTEATRRLALVKLAAITNKIGYPDKWRDYSSVEVKADDFLGNVERANAFESHRQLNKIGKPIDRGEFGMTPPTVNAYYNPLWNEIVFPAGILGPPFFDAQRDLATNYGAIGSVIGHELTHGFDDEGRQYDAQGNLHDWWTAQDTKAFQERADCIAHQYEQYMPLPGVHLNGRLTLGENIADNGGVRIAYAALMSELNGAGQKIDGYSPQKRFFLGFAQAFCENVRPERARELAAIDPHSPDEFRVNGVVSNFAAFGDAFSCKPGDAMTAKATACRVW